MLNFLPATLCFRVSLCFSSASLGACGCGIAAQLPRTGVYAASLHLVCSDCDCPAKPSNFGCTLLYRGPACFSVCCTAVRLEDQHPEMGQLFRLRHEPWTQGGAACWTRWCLGPRPGLPLSPMFHHRSCACSMSCTVLWPLAVLNCSRSVTCTLGMPNPDAERPRFSAELANRAKFHFRQRKL